jgi:riboflavin kinase
MGAVLLPEVEDYPRDKIEVVAPVRLKEALGVKDGDPLILEFVN